MVRKEKHMDISRMREYAFMLVYELEIQKDFSEENIEIFIENNEIQDKDARRYIRRIVKGIKDNEQKIQSIIAEKLKSDWTIERIAKINLALLLEAGNGTPQNLETAYNIFSELAQKGNSRAQLFLADYYRQGIFVKQDMNEAIKWYIEAANQGEEEAVAWLQELGVVKSSEN